MMRGRLVSLKGVRSTQIKAEEQVAWVLDGDRGITYAARCRKDRTSSPANGGRRITAASRWSPSSSGSPTDSASARRRDHGQRARPQHHRDDRVALREVEWRSLGINFVMVFSPNTFAGAPHTHLATVTYPNGSDPREDARILRDAAQAFPP